MMNNTIIKTSNSPWVAPVVLVEKKDGSTRFCVDYQKLNSITKKNAYPLPRIDELLEKIGNLRYYSTLDMAAGYWQVEIAEEDKEKSAFITHMGLFEFNRMPFGLTNAPSTFQRMMDEKLDIFDGKTVRGYIDDIITGADEFDQHLKDVQRILTKLRNTNLTAKFSKCKFFQKELIYLGHHISKKGIRPDPAKVAVIEKIQSPTDISSLRRFLGLVGYYRKFIKRFAKIAHPLHQLLQKGNMYRWNEDCQKAFEELKHRLITAPILAHPDFSKEMMLITDASTKGISAVLSQIQDGQERVIAYASRSLTPAERKYTTTEHECLAVVWRMKQYRPYVHGRKVKAITDHRTLRWLITTNHEAAKLQRWSLKLQPYELEIIH